MEFDPTFATAGNLQAVSRDLKGIDSTIAGLLPSAKAPFIYMVVLTYAVLNSLAQSQL